MMKTKVGRRMGCWRKYDGGSAIPPHVCTAALPLPRASCESLGARSPGEPTGTATERQGAADVWQCGAWQDVECGVCGVWRLRSFIAKI
jgi:hypothetical protein